MSRNLVFSLPIPPRIQQFSIHYLFIKVLHLRHNGVHYWIRPPPHSPPKGFILEQPCTECGREDNQSRISLEDRNVNALLHRLSLDVEARETLRPQTLHHWHLEHSPPEAVVQLGGDLGGRHVVGDEEAVGAAGEELPAPAVVAAARLAHALDESALVGGGGDGGGRDGSAD